MQIAGTGALGGPVEPAERRIARVLFAFDAGEIVLLHGFIKKTEKTPGGEIDIARKRLKEMTI